MNEYIVAKTSNKSMLGHMNDMVVMFEHQSEQYASYEHISAKKMENNTIQYVYGTRNKGAGHYITVGEYWKDVLESK